MPYRLSRSSVKFRGHAVHKIAAFDPNWVLQDCNSSLNSLMALKWCTKLDVVKKRCSIDFQCHPSNFKVTQNTKSPIFTRIEKFGTITPVWIHRWLWNDGCSQLVFTCKPRLHAFTRILRVRYHKPHIPAHLSATTQWQEQTAAPFNPQSYISLAVATASLNNMNYLISRNGQKISSILTRGMK